MANSPLYPLRFKEIIRNYGFGDRNLVTFFDKDGLPEDGSIAETWEVCDRPGLSSIVINGGLAGMTLNELIHDYGADLLGTEIVNRYGLFFPLLIKFLDVAHPLGEQSHPNDEQAARMGARKGKGDPGKTEAWYMVKTDPGATVHCGNKTGISEEEFYQALLNGTTIELMQEFTVKPGDAFLLHAGTIHYSKGGVIFYEIMQNSDLTIGLRPPKDDLPPDQVEQICREKLEYVFLEEDMSAKVNPICVSNPAGTTSYIFCCTHFALERLDLEGEYSMELSGERFYVLSQISGQTMVISGEYHLLLKPGVTCLLPASLRTVILKPIGEVQLLNAYVPDIRNDILEPLRRVGIQDQDIIQLGGRTKQNPLQGFM